MDENNAYRLTGDVRSTVGIPSDIPMVSKMDTQVRLGKDSLELGKDSIEEKPKTAKRFQPPTLEDVKAYCLERKNNVDPERFIDYYTSNGWVVGKNKMKDWKAAVRTWEKNNYSSSTAKDKNNGWCFTPNEDSLDDLF